MNYETAKKQLRILINDKILMDKCYKISEDLWDERKGKKTIKEKMSDLKHLMKLQIYLKNIIACKLKLM